MHVPETRNRYSGVFEMFGCRFQGVRSDFRWQPGPVTLSSTSGMFLFYREPNMARLGLWSWPASSEITGRDGGDRWKYGGWTASAELLIEWESVLFLVICHRSFPTSSRQRQSLSAYGLSNGGVCQCTPLMSSAYIFQACIAFWMSLGPGIFHSCHCVAASIL